MDFLKRLFGRGMTANPTQGQKPTSVNVQTTGSKRPIKNAAQDLRNKVDAYYKALIQEDWNKLDVIGPKIWPHIDRALRDKQNAMQISPVIVYLLSQINQYPKNNPHGKYTGQCCLDGTLKIVKLLTMKEALPEVKKLKETYFAVYSGESQDLVNEVLSNLGMEEEIAAEVIRRKQRPDIAFGYKYLSLTEVLLELKQYYMPNILKRPEDAVRKDGRYTDFINMPSYWHAFESFFDEAYKHLSRHLSTDHPDSAFSYYIQSDGKGLLTIAAYTKSSGYNHFEWRTVDNKYIMMLSDFK